MQPNYPNPFNPSTLIRYELPAQSQVEMVIYNISGQKVTNLVDGIQPAGFHHITWKGQNAFGQEVASGMYFCVMTAKALEGEKSYSKTNKLLLIK
jgi:flagellar hook assembly protein FlgD